MKFPSIILLSVAMLVANASASTSASAGTSASANNSSAKKIFDPSLHFTDDHGKAFDFTSLKGKPLFVSMVYTTCRKTCPVTMDTLKKFDRSMLAQHKNYDFVLFTLDPENDTTEVLAQFRKKHQVMDSRWHFLRGSEADTKAVASVVGIEYVADDHHFLHDFRIISVNEKEEINRVFDWDHRTLDRSVSAKN